MHLEAPEVGAVTTLRQATQSWLERMGDAVATAESRAAEEAAHVAAARAAEAAVGGAAAPFFPPPAVATGPVALSNELVVSLLRAASKLEVAPAAQVSQLRAIASRRGLAL